MDICGTEYGLSYGNSGRQGKLGAPLWMAKHSAGFADHYQAVVKNTGLSLISKEVLTKRGLLSRLDYYLN